MDPSAAMLIYLSALPFIVALMGAFDAFALTRTPLPPVDLPSDAAALAVELRLALAEPFFSTAALLLLLLVGQSQGGPAPTAIALGALAWIIGVPLRCGRIADPILRAVRYRLLRLSLGRWLTLVAPAAFLPQFVWLLSCLGAVLVWQSVRLGQQQLASTPRRSLRPPVAATRPLPPAAPAPAAGQVLAGAPFAAPRPRRGPSPAAAPARPSPAELLLRNGPPAPPLPCPCCGALAPLRELVCPECGLLFASQVPAALAPIARYGYHVVRPLGVGGMSSVYLAYDEASKGWCCVKSVVGVDHTGDTVWRAEAAASLAREASVLVELEHPRVSRLLDWLDDPRLPCMVLGLVAGPSLEQRLVAAGSAGLPVAEVCGWGAVLAEVLAYLAAREQPVAHGDIKPGNVILTGAPALPTLVDFGSAAVLRAGGPGLEYHMNYGTPGYAAPEQYRGQLGPASDVYGLGATLYHLLTGDDPAQHPLQFPRLPALGAELRALLEEMLEVEPGLRPRPAPLAARLGALRNARGEARGG